ncbi:MAG TPA: M12 family metallo-peptidase, partial [Saprospiraceae bacterium]|nr:M12 family metallo-peptidase [Saprospiraceae bacterium]
TYQSVDLFKSGARSSTNVQNEIEKYDLLSINKKSIEALFTNAPDNFKLIIPSNKRSNLSLLLVEVQLPLMELEAAPSGNKIKYRPGKHYRGIIEGQEGSWAALSVYEDEVYGLISEERSESSYVIGKIKGEDTHIFYADEDLKGPQNFSCNTSDSNLPQLKYEEIFNKSAGTSRSNGKCVQLYFEVDNDIVINKGGETGAINYITAVYNQMATLYANEQITTSISKILVWTQTSPYSGTNTGTLLEQFGTTRTSFEGDLAMLVSYKGNGGIAYVNGLCAFQKKFSMGYSSIGSSYNNVPTYSWTVNVLAHEFGLV